MTEKTIIREITIKTRTPEIYKVYDEKYISAFDSVDLKFNANESPAKLCYRLVHDGKNVFAKFESDGITSTINNLFCGTEEEVVEEIKRLGLNWVPVDETDLLKELR